jgi:hypothetical protein
MCRKKFLISGILAGIVIEILSMIVSTAAQALGNYNVLALDGMRNVNDPITALFFVYPFVLGFAMTYVYSKMEKQLKGSYVDKGKNFGLTTWILAGLPSAFLVWSSMNYPIGFTISSLIGSLIYMPCAGIAIAWAYKK